MEKQRSPKAMYTILLGIVLLVFLLLVAFVNRHNASMQPTTTPQSGIVSPSTEKVMKKGAILLQASGAAQLGVPYTIQMNASSNNEDIVGYDAVLKFDPKVLEVTNIQSLNPDLTIYTFKRTNGITITGTKILGKNTATLLNNSPLVQLTVMPKKAGNFVMALESVLDNEKTKLVNAKTNMLSPNVNSINISVGSGTVRQIIVSPTQ